MAAPFSETEKTEKRHARLAQQKIDRLLSFRRPLRPREETCLANLRRLVAKAPQVPA